MSHQSKSTAKQDSVKNQQEQKSKQNLQKQIQKFEVKVNTSTQQQPLIKSQKKNQQTPKATQKEQVQKQKSEVIKTLNQIQQQQKQKIVKLANNKESKQKTPQFVDKENIVLNQEISKSLPKKLQKILTVNQKEHKKSDSLILQVHKNSPKSHIKNFSLVNGSKIYMSEEDIAKLKKLKLENHKRQQIVKKKVIQHDLMVQKVKTEHIISKQHKLQQQKQMRKKSVEQRQKGMSKQREQKMKRFQNQNRKIKQLKKSTKLFQKMQESFKRVEQEQRSGLELMIKSRMGQGVVNFDRINQHEQQYLQKNRSDIENSKVKIKQKIKKLQGQSSSLNLHRSHFYEKVKHQRKQVLEQLEANQNKKKFYSEKIREYQDSVKQNHMPKVVKREIIQEIKKRPHDFTQILSIGNSYMKQSVKLIDRNKSLQLLQKMKTQQIQRSKKKVYKDYLHQLNRTQPSSLQPVQSRQLEMEKQMQKINSIQNPKLKYQKIKSLQTKIEKQLNKQMFSGGKKIRLKNGKGLKVSRIDKDQNEVNEIKLKMKILQGLQNNLISK